MDVCADFHGSPSNSCWNIPDQNSGPGQVTAHRVITAFSRITWPQAKVSSNNTVIYILLYIISGVLASLDFADVISEHSIFVSVGETHIIGYLETHIHVGLCEEYKSYEECCAEWKMFSSFRENSLWRNPAICQKLITTILASFLCTLQYKMSDLYSDCIVSVIAQLYLRVVYMICGLPALLQELHSPVHSCRMISPYFMTCQVTAVFRLEMWWLNLKLWQQVELWFRVYVILLNITIWLVYSQRRSMCSPLLSATIPPCHHSPSFPPSLPFTGSSPSLHRLSSFSQTILH